MNKFFHAKLKIIASGKISIKLDQNCILKNVKRNNIEITKPSEVENS